MGIGIRTAFILFVLLTIRSINMGQCWISDSGEMKHVTQAQTEAQGLLQSSLHERGSQRN